MSGNAFKTVVTIGILVALVGGVTFVKQYVAINTTEKEDSAPTPAVSGLVFPKISEETLYSEMTPTTGYSDYFFTNPSNVPLEVGLELKSCKCSGVDMRVLANPEKEQYLRLTPAGCVAETLTAPKQLLSILTVGAAVQEKLYPIVTDASTWTSMMSDKKEGLIVPAEASGLVRLRWEGKQEGRQRLKVVLWAQPIGKMSGRTFSTIELPMVYVPPINIQPREADVKEIVADSPKSIGFVCFSATRHDFSVTASAENDDPCFEVKILPRSVEDCAKDLQDIEEKFPITKGYLIAVTVHEKRNGKQLDFGPFRRRILVKSEALPDTAFVVVKGIVASDLRVVGDKQNQINVGMFDADSSHEYKATIESDRPELRLALESHAPEIMKVELEKPQPTLAGGQQWTLKIMIPKNSVSGVLPSDSEIVLKTLDAPVRRFRIPVQGRAVFR